MQLTSTLTMTARMGPASAPAVVLRGSGPQGGHVHVQFTGSSAFDQAAEWLKDWGYEWVRGSSGVWQRTEDM